MWINHKEILSKVAVAQVEAADVVVLVVAAAEVLVVIAHKVAAVTVETVSNRRSVRKETPLRTAIAVSKRVPVPAHVTAIAMAALSQPIKSSSNTTIFSNSI